MHTMIKQFMKMGGCKTKEEFYAKYPTEQSFFEAFPQAQMYVRQTGGGAGAQQQQAVQQQQAAAQQQAMINQYIQAYADMNGMTLKEVIRELQRLPGKQQQEALEQIIATVNQAVAQQQQAASTGDMAAAEQAQPGTMPMDPQQAMAMAHGGSKLNRFISKKREFGGAAPMYDDSIYRRPVPNFPRLFQTGGENVECEPGYIKDPNGNCILAQDAAVGSSSIEGVEISAPKTPWTNFFSTVGEGLYKGVTLGQTGTVQGLFNAGLVGTTAYILGKKGIGALPGYDISLVKDLRLTQELEYLEKLAKDKGTTLEKLLESGEIQDPKTGAKLATSELELNKLMAKIKADPSRPFLPVFASDVEAAKAASLENEKLRKLAIEEAEKARTNATQYLYGTENRPGFLQTKDKLFKTLLKQSGKTIEDLTPDQLAKFEENVNRLAMKSSLLYKLDSRQGADFLTAITKKGEGFTRKIKDAENKTVRNAVNWIEDFDNMERTAISKWTNSSKVAKYFSKSPKLKAGIYGALGLLTYGVAGMIDEQLGLGEEDQAGPQQGAAAVDSTGAAVTTAPAVVSQGSAAPTTLAPRMAYPFQQSGNTMLKLDVSDPNNPVYVSEETGDTTLTPEAAGYEPGYVVPKEYGGPVNYGAFTVPYLMNGGTSALPGIVMPDQVIDDRQQTLMDFIKSHQVVQNQVMRRGGSSKKKI